MAIEVTSIEINRDIQVSPVLGGGPQFTGSDGTNVTVNLMMHGDDELFDFHRALSDGIVAGARNHRQYTQAMARVIYAAAVGVHPDRVGVLPEVTNPSEPGFTDPAGPRALDVG